MTAPALVLLDLGDVLTKGFVVHDQRVRRFRFPSAVASRLIDPHHAQGLLLDASADIPRLEGFDPNRFPRTRSYPEAESFLETVRAERAGTPARLAGSIAAVYGEDRKLLGREPTHEHIDALVRRALMLAPASCTAPDVVLLVDVGLKAERLVSYADSSVRSARLATWSFLRSTTRMREVRYKTRVIDAADCTLAVMPAELDVERGGALLVIDIGYFRTKMALLSPEGCEHLEEVHDAGVSDCVRRMLRDGQELGLIEDEIAVIRAFEEGKSRLRLAGGTFELGAAYESARRSLLENLARAAERLLMQHFARRGELCRGLAVIGGGASVVGDALADRLSTFSRLDAVWIAKGASFLLVEGARRLLAG